MLLNFYSNSCSEIFVVFLNSVALPFYLDLRLFFFILSKTNMALQKSVLLPPNTGASQHTTDYRKKQKKRLVRISYSLRPLKHECVPKVVLDCDFHWSLCLLRNCFAFEFEPFYSL